MALILSVLAVFIILVSCELYWRRNQTHGEFSRKFVHVTVGSFVAFWPYFLTANQIKLLSVAFLIVVVVSKYLGIFQAIHSVQRPTLGEIWFAIVVGVLAFTVPIHPHIYTVALLEMSLADGLAAVVGTRFGNSTKYTVFGHVKSIIGTLTFLFISAVLLIAYAKLTPHALPYLVITPLVIAATIIENVAVNGLDNLAVPLSIGGILLLLA
jgi:phytol kinase